MTKAPENFKRACERIMDVYNMFNKSDNPDNAEIERILRDEVMPVLVSDLHMTMIMFIAYHEQLQEPSFMELVYLYLIRYIDENYKLVDKNESLESDTPDFNLFDRLRWTNN